MNVDETPVVLQGGPFEGRINLRGVLDEIISLPLNDELRQEEQNPTVLAGYARLQNAGDCYKFVQVQRIDGKPFERDITESCG